MKIALCFHGLSYGCKDYKTGKGQCFNIIDNTLGINDLKKNGELDIFIHTWNHENYQKIMDTLKPCQIIIETINNKVKEKVIDVANYPSRTIYLKETREYKNLYAKFSNYYSLLEADKLRLNYENLHNIKYDCVIHTRFDIKFRFKKSLSEFDLGNNYYIPTVNNHLEHNYYYDYMIFSSGKSIEFFTNIYYQIDNLIEQIKKDRRKKIKGLKVNNHFIIGYFFANHKIKNVVKLFADTGILVEKK